MPRHCHEFTGVTQNERWASVQRVLHIGTRYVAFLPINNLAQSRRRIFIIIRCLNNTLVGPIRFVGIAGEHHRKIQKKTV